MGFAKYHEDNLRIIEERMYYKNAPDTLSVVHSSYRAKQPVYSAYCPFCHCGVMSSKALVEHIFSSHGKTYEFVYLNNKRMGDSQCDVSKVYSLKFYSFYDETKHIVITDDFDRKYYVDTVKGKYEYDLTNIIKGRLFSYLRIEIPGRSEPYEIQQYLEMNSASIDAILQNRYVSSLFDIQVSNNLLRPSDCLIYLKMLINENEDADPFMQRLESFHFDYVRDLTEVCWYYGLYTGEFNHSLLSNDESKYNLWMALRHILDGEYKKAEELIKNEKRTDNDVIGLRLLCALLTNDNKTIAFNQNKYSYYGIIGILNKILISIKQYEDDITEDIETEIHELSLFSQYVLIQALLDYHDSEKSGKNLEKQSYDLLRESGSIISYLYCRTLSEEAIEKVIKSNTKLHPESKLLKNIALDKNFAWIGRRILVEDGEVYRRKIKDENKKNRIGFSDDFIETFPYDNDISITPLGGENEIGASCFVISYKGYNIMIDAGINPKKKDDASYPSLDEWAGRIDLIVLSHAHIDHSGGVPKAHAMWPEARILMTKPTKVLLKYIYSDMARVKNGITDDYEIENVNIAREVMEDTFSSIATVDYEDQVEISNDINVCFHKAGHIVGAAMIELQIAGKTILYTGDYTDYDQNFVEGFKYSELPRNVDYLITEATYIDRKEFDRFGQAEKIKEEIIKNIDLGKSVLLPAASIGRSQEMICIIGEMLESGLIPNNYKLYIAGMAIPTSTQLIPFFNQSYEALLNNFNEFDGLEYPEERTIVVASSGTMKKGSASYRIEKYWKDYGINFTTIMGGASDEDTEYEYDDWTNRERIRMPLSTHISKNGIMRLIDYTQPKVVSIVHNGSGQIAEDGFVKECSQRFDNDIYFVKLKRDEKSNIFNLLEQIMEV